MAADAHVPFGRFLSPGLRIRVTQSFLHRLSVSLGLAVP